MNCPDCSAQLNDYVDRELSAADARAIEAHVAGCADCRAALASLESLLAQARELPREVEPARNLWPTIHSEVERPRSPSASILRWLVPLAAAAAILLLAALVDRHSLRRESAAPAWSVAAVTGAPRVNTRTVVGRTAFRLGQWLETDAASRARVVVGAIGDVTVDPNSRVRLTGVADANHRLELQRGSLRAFIYAPPRLFFVDTPSATAVDLGCAYTLTVADNGDGELHVTLGYVALEHGDREALIPARAMCLTRKGAGPGTPFVEDAPAALRDALVRFDFTPGAAPSALSEALRHARADDAITLWNLLSRTAGAARAAVFDRLSDLRSVPESVTRAGIVAGDEAMRRAWAADLGFETFGLR